MRTHFWSAVRAAAVDAFAHFAEDVAEAAYEHLGALQRMNPIIDPTSDEAMARCAIEYEDEGPATVIPFPSAAEREQRARDEAMRAHPSFQGPA